jgi:hypothetical protein
MDWGALVGTVLASTVIASAVSGLITWRVQTNSLTQQRLMETTRLLTTLAALGNARDPEGKREHVGLSEQLAAVSSVAAIGRSYPPLRSAAISYMEGHTQIYKHSDPSSTQSIVAKVAGKELAALEKLRS